MDIKMMTNIY